MATPPPPFAPTPPDYTAVQVGALVWPCSYGVLCVHTEDVQDLLQLPPPQQCTRRAAGLRWPPVTRLSAETGSGRAQAVFQVSGSGVSPFNTTKQAVLLIATSSVMTTVTQQQIGIILVEAATSLASRRRLLEADELVVRAAARA